MIAEWTEEDKSFYYGRTNDEYRKIFSEFESELEHLQNPNEESHNGRCGDICAWDDPIIKDYKSGKLSKNEYFSYMNIILKYRGGRKYSGPEKSFAKFLDENNIDYYVEMRGEGLCSEHECKLNVARTKTYKGYLRMDFAILASDKIDQIVCFCEVDGPDHPTPNDPIKDDFFEKNGVKLHRFSAKENLELEINLYNNGAEIANMLRKYADNPGQYGKCAYIKETPLEDFRIG